jgi:hypothetical protein
MSMTIEPRTAARTAKHWSDRLVKMDACSEAVEYARGFATAQEAWDACPHGDWMGWWIDSVETKRQRQLVGAAILRYALLDLESEPAVALVVVWMAEAIERGDNEEIEAAAEAAWAAWVAWVAGAAGAAGVAWDAGVAWAARAAGVAGAAGAAGVAWAAGVAGAIRIVHPQVPR